MRVYRYTHIIPHYWNKETNIIFQMVWRRWTRAHAHSICSFELYRFMLIKQDVICRLFIPTRKTKTAYHCPRSPGRDIALLCFHKQAVNVSRGPFGGPSGFDRGPAWAPAPDWLQQPVDHSNKGTHGTVSWRLIKIKSIVSGSEIGSSSFVSHLCWVH